MSRLRPRLTMPGVEPGIFCLLLVSESPPPRGGGGGTSSVNFPEADALSIRPHGHLPFGQPPCPGP